MTYLGVMQKHIFTEPDGSRLAYSTFGVPEGTPVFFFHGGNDSSLTGRWLHEAALAQGIMLFAPDRPGYGGSDFKPGRAILDWPNSVAALATHLHLDTFAVMGLSGGAPFAAATAFALPERVCKLSLVSGLCPYGIPSFFQGMFPPVRVIFWIAKHAPVLLPMLMRALMHNPTNLTNGLNRLPNLDGPLIEARPKIAEAFVASMQDAHHMGFDGACWEWQLYVKPWGFDTSAIEVPTSLWYGEGDVNVPPRMGHYWAKTVPHAQAHFFPKEGHFSTINTHAHTILHDLCPTTR